MLTIALYANYLFLALPISIFLAVLAFIVTRFVSEPYIEGILRYPLYV